MKRNNNRQIPQFSSAVEVKHRYRFQTASAVSGLLSFQTSDLIAIMGGIVSVQAAGTMTTRCAAKSFKVHSVEAWAPPPTVGSAATLSLKWIGTSGVGGPALSSLKEVSDTTLSSAFPLHISSKPPKNSLAGFWQEFAGGIVFEMNVPLNTIIDITMSHVLDDTGTICDPYTSFSTTAVGFYVWPAIVSSQVVPVSLSG